MPEVLCYHLCYICFIQCTQTLMQGRLEWSALCGCNINHCSVLTVVWNFQALYMHAFLLPGECETIFYSIYAFLQHLCNSVTAYNICAHQFKKENVVSLEVFCQELENAEVSPFRAECKPASVV